MSGGLPPTELPTRSAAEADTDADSSERETTDSTTKGRSVDTGANTSSHAPEDQHGHATNSDEPAERDWPSRCCKIAKVANKYGLRPYLEEQLGEEWKDPDGSSLREIARKFNRELLRKALADTGEVPLDGQVESIYKTLQGEDDGTKGERERTRRHLRRDGVNPEQIEADFVSYRTVDRHFKNCEDRTKVRPEPPAKEEATESALNRVRALQSRLEAVSEKTIGDLTKAGHVDIEDFDVNVGVKVTCTHCGDRYPIHEIIEHGCPTCGTDQTEDDTESSDGPASEDLATNDK